jgi:hypothetical protein
VLSLSPSRREPFLRSAYLGSGVVLDRRVITSVNCFYSQSSDFNSIIEFETQFVIQFNFQSISICNILVCYILYVITSAMTPRNDPGYD